jgi:hypothetical protein
MHGLKPGCGERSCCAGIAGVNGGSHSKHNQTLVKTIRAMAKSGQRDGMYEEHESWLLENESLASTWARQTRSSP